MKKSVLGFGLMAFILVACTAKGTKLVAQPKTQLLTNKNITIPLQAKSGSSMRGVVNISELKEGTIVLILTANNVTPGLHAIHIHQQPDCSSEDGSSAGGHWNPTKQRHGRWGHKDGYHKGDIGVFLADKKGNVDYLFKTNTSSWCIGCNDPTKNILNHAIILHEKTDDFTTQPTGNAGGRIACGVIK